MSNERRERVTWKIVSSGKGVVVGSSSLIKVRSVADLVLVVLGLVLVELCSTSDIRDLFMPAVRFIESECNERFSHDWSLVSPSSSTLKESKFGGARALDGSISISQTGFVLNSTTNS